MPHRPIAIAAAWLRRHVVRRSAVRRSRCRAGPQRGTTLIEAMVVLAVLGILLAGAAPGAARFISAHRAVAATDDFVHALALARGEALKRGRRVYLAPAGATWHHGWAVFVDRNDNRLFDPTVDEVIVRHAALPASVTITNPSNRRAPAVHRRRLCRSAPTSCSTAPATRASATAASTSAASSCATGPDRRRRCAPSASPRTAASASSPTARPAASFPSTRSRAMRFATIAVPSARRRPTSRSPIVHV